ncbi:MAG: hypothetical protein EON92_20095 [Burkholderiales bacterium]|nr:MAG: hypothetical protein EON92_20095 [Burkholderiales bacterium]
MPQQKLNIFLVDDDHIYQFTAKKTLEAMGVGEQVSVFMDVNPHSPRATLPAIPIKKPGACSRSSPARAPAVSFGPNALPDGYTKAACQRHRQLIFGVKEL